jgi:tetratricopeptide (TPR) repeat protein
VTLDRGDHPEAERLAEYVDGLLEVEARRELERHFADCADCRAVVMETMAFLDGNPADATGAPTVVPFRSRSWVRGLAAGLGVAAAITLAIRVAPPEGLFGRRGVRPEFQALVAAVSGEQTRLVEGRLTGGFTYAPPPSPTRARSEPRTQNLGLLAAVEARKSAAAADPTGENLHALGVAQLLLGQYDEALETFARAVPLLSRNAPLQSDIASAYLARAETGVNRADAEHAMAAADAALAIEPRFPPALFNRALAAERTTSPALSAAAWSAFIDAEADQRWKDEAQQHLLALVPRSTS